MHPGQILILLRATVASLCGVAYFQCYSLVPGNLRMFGDVYSCTLLLIGMLATVVCNVHFCLSPAPVDAQALATVVSEHMGGAMESHSLSQAYTAFQAQLKDRLQSCILPIGSLAVGLPRHRALLFKTLADACELPCCLLRGDALGKPTCCLPEALYELAAVGGGVMGRISSCQGPQQP